MPIPNVTEHRDEVIGVLGGLNGGTAKRRVHLPELVRRIFDDLTSSCVHRRRINDSIRQIHNRYGWMATKCKCAGALYRTETFLNIPRGMRDPSQDKNKRTIHIEHTVPVSDLERTLRWHRAQFTSLIELHSFLMTRSICVAFSQIEEAALNAATSTNDAFDKQGRQVAAYPFRRYLPLVNHMK